MNEDFVSVIITTYNAAKYIEETINSVLEQTYQNFEIIIVDDSSTDDTLKVIENIKDSRIYIYKIEHSGRPAIPRNFGIKKAKGNFTAFLDGDDIWTKNKLEEQIKYFKKFTDAIFIYSASVTFGKVNFFSPHYEVLPLLFNAAKSKEELINSGNTISCSSVIAKTNLLREINGFDEDKELKAIEDYDLWLRLSDMGNFYFIPKILVKYRVHESQTSGSWERKQEKLYYLAQKRKLNLPNYKFRRNKGLPFLLIRNSVHFLNYLLYKIIEKI